MMEDWYDALATYENKHGCTYGVEPMQNLIKVWDLFGNHTVGLFTKEQAYCLFKGLDMFHGDFAMFALQEICCHAAEWKEIVESQAGDASIVEDDRMTPWELYAYYKYIYEFGYDLLEQA